MVLVIFTGCALLQDISLSVVPTEQNTEGSLNLVGVYILDISISHAQIRSCDAPFPSFMLSRLQRKKFSGSEYCNNNTSFLHC